MNMQANKMLRSGITLMVVCVLFSLMGCSTSKPIESTSKPENSAPKPVEKTGQQSIPTAKPDQKPKEIDGFSIMADEIESIVGPGSGAQGVLKVFGTPDEKTEAEVWGADGLEHQSWIYKQKGVEFGLVANEDNKQVVVSILMSGASKVKTSKNIHIGSSKEEVLKAYADEINHEDDLSHPDELIVGTVYGGIIFTVENEKVSTIFIGAAAE